MTVKELARLVKQMRDLQKRFFRGERSSSVLHDCKALEHQVDDAIARVLDGQRDLFGPGLEPDLRGES